MPINRRPLRDDVYRELCDRIVLGELAPGARVRDGALARQLGVSRTPVREAILRLAHQGLIDTDLGRGFTVRWLTREELRDATGIVAALECLALRESDVFPDARLHDLDDLTGRLVDCTDPTLALRLDDEWHQVLIAGCGDHALHGVVGPMRDAIRRYSFALLRDGGRPSFAADQHLRVTEALRNGDRRQAESTLLSHWYDCRRELAQWLDSRGSLTQH